MKIHRKIAATLFSLLINIGLVEGTPSTVFWTVCTTDVYQTGTGHIDEDNYFTISKHRGNGYSLPPDTGFELGVFSWKDFGVEAGVDYLGGTNDPWFMNAGIGLAENKLFSDAPSFKIGIFNAGTRYHGGNKTSQNIVDFIIGKSLPCSIGGRFCVGGFSGSRAMGKNRQGFMVSYQKPFFPAKYSGDRDYNKLVLCADYASGKNSIGGGGIGLYYYFTPDVSILTGPVWFNSKKINGTWKWSVQIDVSFSVFDPIKT